MANQDVLVDLDLHGNKISRVAPGAVDGDVVVFEQLGDSVQVPTTPPPPPGSVIVWDPAAGDPPGTGGWVPVDPADPTSPVVPTSRSVIAGVGLTGGGPLSGDVTLNLGVGGDSGLTVDEFGVWVNDGTAINSDASGVSVKYDPTSLELVIDGDTLGVNQAWLAGEIANAASKVTAGNGIAIDPGAGTGGEDVILARLSGSATNALIFGGDGGLLVQSLNLANTYVGSGTDSATINADIAPAVAEAGDLYINNVDGRAFICSNTAAATWVELAAAPAGIVDIVSPDGSINVLNGTPPQASLQVGAALQAEITAATSNNLSQDGRLMLLEAASHVPAVAGTGIAAIDATQTVAIDRSVVDTWYPAIPSTTPPPADGTTIVWEGGGWTLLGPPTAPPGATIGSATVVVYENVPSGISTLEHNFGNNSATVTVKNGPCHVAASVCDDPSDPGNKVQIETEPSGGPYTVIITGIQS